MHKTYIGALHPTKFFIFQINPNYLFTLNFIEYNYFFKQKKFRWVNPTKFFAEQKILKGKPTEPTAPTINYLHSISSKSKFQRLEVQAIALHKNTGGVKLYHPPGVILLLSRLGGDIAVMVKQK